jgi:phosphatidylserine/phosphatidylglycerophosphate/cardiolipin synthase-like enzyme
MDRDFDMRLPFAHLAAAVIIAGAALTSPALSRDNQVVVEQVCFTPGQDCEGVVVATIRAAQREILVQAYSFTSPEISKALIDAHRRGVTVKVVLDKSQRSEKYSSADFLANQGISVVIDARHAIAHNKVMVLDNIRVISGSYNYTRSAQERNAENLMVLRDAGLAKMYAENWRVHAEHSEAYAGKGRR